MISIKVNGEEKQVKEGTTVDALLTGMNVRRDALAVERNRTIVPRTAYGETVLEEGDVLEIVSLVGGG